MQHIVEYPLNIVRRLRLARIERKQIRCNFAARDAYPTQRWATAVITCVVEREQHAIDDTIGVFCCVLCSCSRVLIWKQY